MPRLDELALHLAGGLAGRFANQSSSDDNDIVWDKLPSASSDDDDIVWDDKAPQSPLHRLSLLSSGLADPLRLRQRLLNVPSPETTLGTAGVAIGAETGPFAPMAAPILAGLGGAAGRAIELTRESQTSGIPGRLPVDAPSQILKSGILNSLLGVAPTALRGTARFGGNLLKAQKGLQMFSKLADESAFIKRIRLFLQKIPERAGGRFKDEFVDNLVKTNPEKIGDFTRSISGVRQLLRENPAFREEQLRRLARGSPQTVETMRRVFPELLDISGAGEGTVGGGARGLRITGEELRVLEERAAGLESDVGRPLGTGETLEFGRESSPTQLTLEESQRIKRFFKPQFLKTVGKESFEISSVADDARTAYHSLKADQIGQFEGFEQASNRYHQELLDHRLLKRSTGGFSEEGIPTALRTNFRGEPTFSGGGIGRAPEIREAAQRVFLDDPQLANQADLYQHAAQFSDYRTQLLRRLTLYAPLSIGVYGTLAAARRSIGQALFGGGTRR